MAKSRRSSSKRARGAGPKGSHRPLWSGTLAFGLVTLPVDLYTTTRSAGASLRMIDEDGTPLKRRYVCQRDEELLDTADIVRGYPVDDDTFVMVEDDELDALDPQRSSVIDLETFVPAEDVDPSYIENTYVLVPNPDANTAYRLLVTSMAAAGRAGIATFVMRGTSYVVAIISRDGTLRAATLRYHDELRSPEDIGLPELQTADVDEVKRYEKAMARLLEDELDPAELRDRGSERLRKVAKKKLAKGRDVHTVAEDDVEPDDGPAVDIMELLRQSLGEKSVKA